MGRLLNAMKTPEGLTAFFTGLLCLVTLGAVIYAGVQVSDARGEARVQHLLTFEQEFQAEPLASFRSIVAQRRLKNEAHGNELYPILSFFDTVGLLVHRGYLDEDDVWETFSYWILDYYADNSQEIAELQREDANTYAQLSWLVRRMEQIDRHHRGTGANPSKADLTQFYREESEVRAGIPAKPHK